MQYLAVLELTWDPVLEGKLLKGIMGSTNKTGTDTICDASHLLLSVLEWLTSGVN
jgi:hypothetical protein